MIGSGVMGWGASYSLKPIPCKQCGTPFKPLTKAAEYCKPECRQKYNNALLQKRRDKAKGKG